MLVNLIRPLPSALIGDAELLPGFHREQRVQGPRATLSVPNVPGDHRGSPSCAQRPMQIGDPCDLCRWRWREYASGRVGDAFHGYRSLADTDASDFLSTDAGRRARRSGGRRGRHNGSGHGDGGCKGRDEQRPASWSHRFTAWGMSIGAEGAHTHPQHPVAHPQPTPGFVAIASADASSSRTQSLSSTRWS